MARGVLLGELLKTFKILRRLVLKSIMGRLGSFRQINLPIQLHQLSIYLLILWEKIMDRKKNPQETSSREQIDQTSLRTLNSTELGNRSGIVTSSSLIKSNWVKCKSYSTGASLTMTSVSNFPSNHGRGLSHRERCLTKRSAYWERSCLRRQLLWRKRLISIDKLREKV